MFNNKDTLHLVVVDRVRRLVEDFNKYSRKIYGAKLKPPHRSPKSWRPPSVDVAKINYDAHLAIDGWVGQGVVGRNDKGEILFAGCIMRGRWPCEIAECKVCLLLN